MIAEPGPHRNPYRPGAGIAPTYLAGRDRILRRVDNTLLAAPELPANIKITGLRGVGKTVLLKEIERRASESLGWVTSREQIVPRHNQEADLASLISGLSDKPFAGLPAQPECEQSSATSLELPVDWSESPLRTSSSAWEDQAI